jgi:sugar lactone lactonase YvrE
MRRFLTLISLLCLAIPAGVSISGCSRDPGANYCNGLGYGMKITDVAVISLSPATTGISLAYGQTTNVSTPAATTCKSSSATVASYSYGTTNNQLVDIAPSGSICAGTWNRNSGGGIGNYTICNPPNPLPSTNGLPYSVAYITASADSIVSNPVPVFVHAPATSVSLVTTSLSGATGQQCYSQGAQGGQGAQAALDVQVCYAGADNKQYLLCAPSSVNTANSACPGGFAPGVTSVPSCSTSVGILSYSVNNTAIAAISSNTITNQAVITAVHPGTTAITAYLSGSGSSAGFFSTCPPKSISVALASGATTGSITQGVTQDLVTTVYDTQNYAITGLSLTYQSTDPADISVSGNGAISTTYPGTASIYAICEPPSCNPAPIYETGLFGTGLPVSSNPVTITTPGTASDYLWFGAPGQSQYIFPINLLYGSVGASIRLPYVPNSMVADPLGNFIYFGSPHELMTFSTSTNSVTTQNTNAPGVVLAVSPDGSMVLVNDQDRKIFYLLSNSGGQTMSLNGLGTAAAWTPDSKTLYITGTDVITGKPTLWVYNANTGWKPEDLSSSTGGSKSLAITIPSVGAYLSGSAGFSTVAHTWCPTGTVGDFSSFAFYPASGDSFDVQTDVLTATTDGNHILGAAVVGSETTLNDIAVDIVPAECSLSAALSTNGKLVTTTPLDLSVNATAVNQIVASPASNLAFVTYSAAGANTNAVLPYYQPNTIDPTKPGTVSYLPLTTQSGGVSPSAPLAGIFTPDDKLFFVSTSGDNMIHEIDVPTLTDKLQISPNLPACTPGSIDLGCTYSGTDSVVPATAIAVKPRSTT